MKKLFLVLLLTGCAVGPTRPEIDPVKLQAVITKQSELNKIFWKAINTQAELLDVIVKKLKLPLPKEPNKLGPK